MTDPQVTITLKSDGRVQLQANIDNQVAVYGILEMGKDAVRAAFAKAAAGNNIVAAPAEALNQLQSAAK